LLVYIREAHALDSAMPTDFEMIEDPIDIAERSKVAHQCVDDLDLPMPALIDGIDDKVGLAYGGWPDRLYLIGKDGRLAYAGAQGPGGFDPEALAKAIADEVVRIKATKAGQSEPGKRGK
jgi:hypothetical protein